MLQWKKDGKYTSREAVVIEKTNRGDTAPFRLERGDYSILALKPEDLTFAEAYDCLMTLELRPYGGREGRSIVKDARLGVEETRLNAVGPGVYFIHIEANQDFCTPDIVITRA